MPGGSTCAASRSIVAMRGALAPARRGVAVHLGGREHVVADDAVGSAPPLRRRAPSRAAPCRPAALRVLSRAMSRSARRGYAPSACARTWNVRPKRLKSLTYDRAEVDLQRVEDVRRAARRASPPSRGRCRRRAAASPARNVVKTPVERADRRARRRRSSSVASCSARKPRPAAVLHHELEAARRPEALHGRRRDHEDVGLDDLRRAAAGASRAARRRSARARAPRTAPGRRRSRRRSSCSRASRPRSRRTRPRSGRPGVARMMSPARRTTASVRSSDAPSGSWIATIR